MLVSFYVLGQVKKYLDTSLAFSLMKKAKVMHYYSFFTQSQPKKRCPPGISSSSEFNSTSPDSFKLLVIVTLNCYKSTSAVKTTSKLTKTVIHKNYYLNACHHT